MRRSIPASIAIVALASAALLAQPPTFRGGVDLVRVDALVTDGRTPVLGLRADDFEVLDDGVPQQITLLPADELPVNLVLALDTSDSVTGRALEELRAAGRTAISVLRPGDEAGLVTFSGAVAVPLGLTRDTARLGPAFDRPARAGDTALFDASYTAMAIAESDESRALVLVFSDGLDTNSVLTSDAVLDAAKRMNTVVYGITVADPTRPTFLTDLSHQAGGRLIGIPSTKDLGPEFVTILDEFHHRYVMSYAPHGVPPGGWHRLEVRLTRRRATINARPGYLAGP
jgi:VWFA-related protein